MKNKSIMALSCATLLLASCGSEANKPASEETSTETVQTEAVFEDVTAPEAKELLSGPDDITVLDVRTPAEFESEHIKNAINIDYKADDFREKLAELDRDKHYVMHCRSGGRSTPALEIMKELGFNKVSHMNKGLISWTEAGLPVEQQSTNKTGEMQ